MSKTKTKNKKAASKDRKHGNRVPFIVNLWLTPHGKGISAYIYCGDSKERERGRQGMGGRHGVDREKISKETEESMMRCWHRHHLEERREQESEKGQRRERRERIGLTHERQTLEHVHIGGERPKVICVDHVTGERSERWMWGLAEPPEKMLAEKPVITTFGNADITQTCVHCCQCIRGRIIMFRQCIYRIKSIIMMNEVYQSTM
jgi:hypothetical protein